MVSDNRTDKPDIDLLELIAELLRHKIQIAAITLASIVLFTLYALCASPVYRANMLIQVDETSSQNLLDRITDNMVGDSQHSATEIGLLQSRMVLGKVSESLGMLTDVKPSGFLARLFSGRDGARSALTVGAFAVPAEYINVPLTLQVTGPDRYQLTLPEGETLTGRVNQPLRKGELSLLVTHINAEPDSEYTITHLYELDVVESLLKQLKISDVGKESGLLSVQLTGKDKVQIARTLNAIGRYYLEQGLARKAEETTKRLQFVDDLLPDIEKRLNDAIASLRDFQQQNESVDMSLEAKTALDTTSALQTQLNEVMFRRAEMSKLYTPGHPMSRSLAEKEAVLKKQLSQLNRNISTMPRKQQEILKLTRDVQTNQEIYTQMLTRRQELQIMKASTVNNARIVDPAVAETRPVAPKKSLLCIMGMLLGLMASCGWVMFKKAMRNGLHSAADIEESGVEVLAMVPVSKWLKQQNQKISRKLQVRSCTLLAKENSTDVSVEAIRNLRTSITLGLARKSDAIIAVSSATTGVGKSFVASNLAVVLAQANKRVLLIDADLRCGTQHHLLSCPQKPGLSEVLNGRASFQDALRDGPEPGMKVLPCGQYVNRSSELLMHSALTDGLRWASNQFDYVIIDTPPVLPITDAVILGKQAGRVILVAGYNKESQQEFALAVKRFEGNGVPLFGAVLNGIEPDTHYGYRYETFQYGSTQAE